MMAGASAFAVTAAIAAEPRSTLAGGGGGTFQFPSPDSRWRGRNHDLIGTVELPDAGRGRKSRPAMILFHGSAGPGYRSDSWARFFRRHGIVTMRVDYFTTRGLRRAGRRGPAAAGDVTGAIRFLATHPGVDKRRIGVMGFSRGGSIVLMARSYSLSQTGNVRPALFVAFYPGCERIRIGAGDPDAPLLIVVGSADTLSSPAACEQRQREGQRVGKPVRTLVLPGGTHAFDVRRSRTVRWRGRRVSIISDRNLTRIARREVLKTVKAAFRMR
jgi:dienelactone hydrolase